MNAKTHSHRTPVAASSAESGFTLVEIMVVIVILGLLATLVARNVIGSSDEARIGTAKMNVRTIADAVRSHRSKTGILPESLEELVMDDEGKGELIELNDDPWGNPYVLLEGDTPNGWEVISYGPNGLEGDEDDISSKTRDRDN